MDFLLHKIKYLSILFRSLELSSGEKRQPKYSQVYTIVIARIQRSTTIKIELGAFY